MRRMTCIVVLVCTAYYQNTNLAAIPFSKTDVEFASIPFDQIPFDVTSIDLGGNNLSDITFFPPFAQLSTLSIYDQPNVTVFPNLENISEPLVDLAIMRCSLSYIEPYRLQILTNLENLNLVANLLTSPFPDMNPALGCNLLQLNLHKNRLHEMPHLHTIAKSLKVLNLGNNLNIGHLPKETLGLYRELTSMQCGICSLRSIPDFSLLAEVHRGPSLSIRLRNNHITSIHAEDLRPVIGRSWTLDIKSNPIKHIMNMLHLRRLNQLSMRKIPVLCDCRLRWLKAAGQHQKTAVAFETVECDGPGSTTVKLQDTPYENLVCNDSIQQSRIEAFPADSVPVPPVRKVLDGSSLLNCATLCVQDSKCLIFAYNGYRNAGRCGLTDADDLASGNATTPPDDWRGNGIKWFVVDV